MPVKMYNPYLSTWEQPIFDQNLVCVLDSGFKLRQHLPSGVYSPDGVYEDATITFPAFSPSKLGEIIGVDYAANIPDGTDIQVRLSTDNGTQFQIYDILTSLWRSANPDEFNSIDDINSGMSTLSLDPNRTITIQVKLFANHVMAYTPILNCFVFYFELEEYTPYQDIGRSIKIFIEDNLSAKLRYARKVITISNIIQLDVNFNVKEIKSVYNLTTDVSRVYNIYDSYDNNTKVITLSAMVYPGDIVEINYRGCPEVIICQDPDYEESDLPRILIEITEITENSYGTFFLHMNENPSNNENVRMRQVPIQKDYRIVIESLCPSGLDSYAYAHSLDKLLRGLNKINAVESGALISCVDFHHFRAFDIASNNLKVKRINFIAVLDDYFDNVEQKKKIQDIVITYGLTRKF